MPEGIIIKGIGGFYYIKTETGIYETRARGLFRKDEIVPLPGDRVDIQITDEVAKSGHINGILERDTVLIRPAVANVNQMVIVISVIEPGIDYYLLDKLLITAGLKGIKPVMCVNKVDLAQEGEHIEIAQVYKNAGYDVFFTSSKINVGFDELREILINRVTVFAGQSGVGKSTILNNIIDKLVMETSEVSQKIKRGRHTTRHAELLQLKDGGFVLDTPGFSSFYLDDIELENLDTMYPEFKKYIGECKYYGCSHINEPACAVKEALVNNNIDQGRYNRYKFFREAIEAEIKVMWKKKKRK